MHIETSSPEFFILGTVDEDVAGAVAGEEEVAERDHDAEVGKAGEGKGNIY